MARTVFTGAMGTAGWVGAGILLVAAIIVWKLTPRDLDIAAGHD